jgi:hypothetical protein
MAIPFRVTFLRFALAGVAVLVVAASNPGCRKLIGGAEETSMGDIEANLEELIEPAKAGLDLQVSPRFLTFGPLPNATPWDAPVPGSRTFETHGKQVAFKTGRVA